MTKPEKNRKKYIVALLVIANLGLIWYSVFEKKPEDTFYKSAREGKVLAETYCQSCHALPNPLLLSKEMWIKGAMPTMGPFFGIKGFKGLAYHSVSDVAPSTFPDKPILDSIQWQKISDYYYMEAPDHLPAQDKDVSKVKVLPFFSAQLPKSTLVFGKVAMASYVRIDTSITPRRILVNDAMEQKLYVFDNKLDLVKINSGLGLITDIDFQSNQILESNMGKNVEANNLRQGDIRVLKIQKDLSMQKGKILFKNLARPVKLTSADLDNDGKTDYIISEFGNIIGSLTLMQNQGNDRYKKIIMRNQPGVLNTIVYDYNKDGMKDVWALFAQGNEGIFVFTNKKNGRLEEKQVLKFPPSYGSTHFELVDFNKDGYQDILYTCGDNADFTPELKPYHGIYIFLNDGKNNFEQKYFYPINGCYKALARDFDRDGDLDIAAISFFPSSLQPEEAFTYLQNEGSYTFSPYRLPYKIPFEKGITMDVGDLDQDGKLDILLGNGYYNSKKSERYLEPLFILLKNTMP